MFVKQTYKQTLCELINNSFVKHAQNEIVESFDLYATCQIYVLFANLHTQGVGG